MRTFLVTGGCGFVGSHFIRRILSRTPWRVVNLDAMTYAADPARLEGIGEETGAARYRFVRGDISDSVVVGSILADEHPWAVLNFAAESHVDRSILDAAPFVRTNVIGVQTLLDTCRAAGVERFVQISTDEVYGDREGLEPATEDSPLRPGSPYAASKAAGDLLCLAAGRTHSQAVVIVRCVNTYGPYQHPEKLIPLMVHRALAKEPLPIYGDGLQVRDWLHVDDACAAIALVLEDAPSGAVFNAAGGNLRTNLDVVQMVCRVVAHETDRPYAGVAALIRHGADRPGHDRHYSIRDDRLRAELGWAPAVPSDQGLEGAVRWYVHHREWLAAAFHRSPREYFESVYEREWGRRR